MDQRGAGKSTPAAELRVRLWFNPIALRKTKIAYNYGLSECNRVKRFGYFSIHSLSAIFIRDIMF